MEIKVAPLVVADLEHATIFQFNGDPDFYVVSDYEENSSVEKRKRQTWLRLINLTKMDITQVSPLKQIGPIFSGQLVLTNIAPTTSN